MMYFVGGHPRTGTSMMMKCLGEGGLRLIYDRLRNQKIIKKLSTPEYKINEELYELHRDDYDHPRFREWCTNGVVKIPGPEITKYVQQGDKVVFMRRDYDEVRASCEKMTDFPVLERDVYLSEQARIVETLRARGCIVLSVNYHKVLDDPLYVFNTATMFGWPIDPEKAASAVDHEQYRIRKVA
jgi:hypothetical protein